MSQSRRQEAEAIVVGMGFILESHHCTDGTEGNDPPESDDMTHH